MVVSITLAGVAPLFGSTLPPGGELAFSSNKGEHGSIELMDVFRGLTVHLLPKSQTGIYPVWSPNGQQIAFTLYTQNADRKFYLCVIDSNGKNLRRLVPNSYSDNPPVWSPDSNFIAFTSDHNGSFQIYVTDTKDGSDLRQLTNSSAINYYPEWSPAGEQIAFMASADTKGSIYLINPDGSDLFNLTQNFDDAGQAVWSPDGHQIAFEVGYHDLYVINADGSDLQNLTHNIQSYVAGPAWSPDGRQLAFYGSDRGNVGVMVINKDGSKLHFLAAAPNSFDLSWSSDSQQIAFSTNRSLVYVVNADGTNLRNLTYVSFGPSWHPQR